jgi:hypothetical protein
VTQIQVDVNAVLHRLSERVAQDAREIAILQQVVSEKDTLISELRERLGEGDGDAGA